MGLLVNMTSWSIGVGNKRLVDVVGIIKIGFRKEVKVWIGYTN